MIERPTIIGSASLLAFFINAVSAAERQDLPQPLLTGLLDEIAEVEPRPIAPEPHPFTIEPGRFSIEFTPLHYTRDSERGLRVRTWSMPITSEAGILSDLDIQIGFDPIISEREDDRELGTRTISRGFGDVILRTKYNLWGNDELVHDTALGLMPFVHIPTERTPGNGSRPIDAGLLVSFAVFPWEGLDIEWTPGFAGVRGIDTSRHVFEFSSDLVFNQKLYESIIGFIEFGSAITSERGQSWVGVLGVGLTFEPTDDFVIEPAAHFGVTSAAADLVLSLTFVLRF